MFNSIKGVVMKKECQKKEAMTPRKKRGRKARKAERDANYACGKRALNT